MVLWVVGSILHDGPIELLLDWCNKGMCYPVCGIVHIKYPFLSKRVADVVAAVGFLLLSEWSFTIRPTHITILKCVECVIK